MASKSCCALWESHTIYERNNSSFLSDFTQFHSHICTYIGKGTDKTLKSIQCSFTREVSEVINGCQAYPVIDFGQPSTSAITHMGGLNQCPAVTRGVIPYFRLTTTWEESTKAYDKIYHGF
jgi:hypothetical protein